MKQYSKEFLQEPFFEFIKQIEQINFYKSFIKELVEKNQSQLLEQKDLMYKNYGKDNIFTGLNGLSFLNPFNGLIEPLSVYKRTIDDDIDSLKNHYNKQYQWLLAEAYEYYEEFLSKLYAYVGYIDNSFWAMKDFVNISSNEISNKDLNWFKEQSIKPDYIVKQIRKKIPQLVESEKNNFNKIDFKFYITFIEHLRHIIVHKQGITKKEIFVKKMLEKLGVYNKGNYNKKYDDIINIYFKKRGNKDIIVLLDIPKEMGFYSILSPLIENLISFSYMLNHFILLTLESKKLVKN